MSSPGFCNAFNYDFNNPRGYFSVKKTDFEPPHDLRVGDKVILVAIEKSEEHGYDGFGIVVTITEIRESQHRPEYLSIQTDYPEVEKQAPPGRG